MPGDKGPNRKWGTQNLRSELFGKIEKLKMRSADAKLRRQQQRDDLRRLFAGKLLGNVEDLSDDVFHWVYPFTSCYVDFFHLLGGKKNQQGFCR